MTNEFDNKKEKKPVVICENLVKIYKVADLEVAFANQFPRRVAVPFQGSPVRREMLPQPAAVRTEQEQIIVAVTGASQIATPSTTPAFQ